MLTNRFLSLLVPLLVLNAGILLAQGSPFMEDTPIGTMANTLDASLRGSPEKSGKNPTTAHPVAFPGDGGEKVIPRGVIGGSPMAVRSPLAANSGTAMGVAPGFPGPSPLTRDNLLGIPIRPGRLEISAMFQRRSGAILRSDPDGFSAVLDSYSLEVVPVNGQKGRVQARIEGGSNPQLPAEPVMGTIATDGTNAEIRMDDGKVMKISFLSSGKYVFQASFLPIKVTARYLD